MRIAILLYTLLHYTHAATCPPGVTPPTVVTVMASTSNPTKDAWVVFPDCTLETYSIDDDNAISLESDAIQRIVSLPSGIQLL